MKKTLLGILALIGMMAATSAMASPEPWYFNFGLGYGIPSYPSELQPSIDTLKAAGASNSPIAVDIGAYWPVAPASILGVAINGLSDQYTVSSNRIGITQTGFFASGMHFFGAEPGDGFYFRGDAGMARASVDTNFGIGATSNAGLGLGAGIGYGIPVSSETRILIQAMYMYRRIEGANYSSTSVSVSGLF